MKRTLGLMTGVMLLAGAGLASAQDVIIVPEQEVIIREYVIEHPVEPVPAIDGIEVGQVIPPEVVLYPIESPDMMYSYVVMDNRTLIVEPQTRQIVRIIE